MGFPLSNVGAAGAATTLTIRGKIGRRIRITGLNTSFSAAPVASVALTVSEAGNNSPRLNLDLAAIGPQNLYPPDGGWLFEPGQDVTVTVAAPGGAVITKINAAVEYPPVQEGEE
jgi:hypothetical protein